MPGSHGGKFMSMVSGMMRKGTLKSKLRRKKSGPRPKVRSGAGSSGSY